MKKRKKEKEKKYVIGELSNENKIENDIRGKKIKFFSQSNQNHLTECNLIKWIGI